MFEAGDWRLKGPLEWSMLAGFVLQSQRYCYCTIQDETVKKRERTRERRSHDVRGGESERQYESEKTTKPKR